MELEKYPHLTRDEQGRLRTKEGWFKVFILLEEFLDGVPVEGLVENHPPLSLEAAHGMLAYYCDHKEAIDAELAERKRVYEEWRLANWNEPLQAKFRALLEARMAALA